MKLLPKRFSKQPTVNVITLAGVIASGGRFGGSNLNDASTANVIERAFKKGKPSAVAIKLNSPGGSPVQSSLIAARIRRLAEEKEIPVFAFCEDVAASGGYWLATAADEIYVDDSSVIGSIGVISASFGFHELLERQGVERRVHTAGENKSLMDPFKPEKPEEVARLKDLQKVIHDNFILQVKSRRGDKLIDRDLFTGEVWVGKNGIEVGLADHIGHLVPVMMAKFGEKVRFNMIGQKRSFMSRLGLGAAVDITGAIEDRALWAKYGL